MKIDIPGYKILSLDYLVLDYNGTIAADGVVPDDMKERLRALADRFRNYVVTADTHGNARSECEGLPIAVMDAEGVYGAAYRIISNQPYDLPDFSSVVLMI